MSAMIESKVEAKKEVPVDTINREKTCPLMLRVFCSNGRHNSAQDYRRGSTPSHEIIIYTWMNATLKELTNLILNINPEARTNGTTFDFITFYPDLKNVLPKVRDLGVVTVGVKSFDDTKTLQQLGFIIGDFIDVAISPPGRGPPPRRNMNRPYGRM